MTADEIHNMAMALADKGAAIFKEAAEMEEVAAKIVGGATSSRAILARSAAWLWLQSGSKSSAIRVAEWGLATAPGFIDGQLRDVIAAAGRAE